MTGGTVVVFARAPEHGRVKTRLAARFGADAALALHRAFLRDTLESVRQAGARVVLAHTPSAPFAEQSLADDLIVQRGAGFGERFDAALADTHTRLDGDQRYLILGADSPHLGPFAIRDALERLHAARCVVGPNDRHGFYALGFRGPPLPVTRAFEADDQCSMIEVLVGREALPVRLPTFYDLDLPEDLARLQRSVVEGDDGWLPRSTFGVLGDLISG